jgi:hypothetical protein
MTGTTLLLIGVAMLVATGVAIGTFVALVVIAAGRTPLDEETERAVVIPLHANGRRA